MASEDRSREALRTSGDDESLSNVQFIRANLPSSSGLASGNSSSRTSREAAFGESFRKMSCRCPQCNSLGGVDDEKTANTSSSRQQIENHLEIHRRQLKFIETEDSAIGENRSTKDENTETSAKKVEQIQSATKEGSSKNRNGEVGRELGKERNTREITASKLHEYSWPMGSMADKYFIQEQLAVFLDVESFKRKYPDLLRRAIVESEEKTYLLKNEAVTLTQLNMGLVALRAEDIYDLMTNDYPEKFEEYKKVVAERNKQAMAMKQMQAIKAAEAAVADVISTPSSLKPKASVDRTVDEVTEAVLSGLISANDIPSYFVEDLKSNSSLSNSAASTSSTTSAKHRRSSISQAGQPTLYIMCKNCGESTGTPRKGKGCASKILWCANCVEAKMPRT